MCNGAWARFDVSLVGQGEFTRALFKGKRTPYSSVASTIILQSVDTHGGKEDRGDILPSIAFLFDEVAARLFMINSTYLQYVLSSTRLDLGMTCTQL
jgi:hypothetical protein